MDSDAGTNQLDNVRETWESLAQRDPLWAILSCPDKKGNEWKRAEFFQTGVTQIDQLMQTLRHHEIFFDTDTVLDFGCGVGRLSQALLPYFNSITGVDVSPTMISMARALNKEPTRCEYFLNQREDLKLFQEQQFSLVYSIIVLQHLPAELARKYIAEFVRILRPNGLPVFQLPSRFIQERELPPAAFSAIIACHDEKLTVPTNRKLNLRIEVENSSPVPWDYDEPFSISLGNHWIDAAGMMRVMDDGRKILPPGLLPGQKVEVALEVKTPAVAGAYLLELDLVQERVTWFKTMGSKTSLIEVDVLESVLANNEQIARAARVEDLGHNSAKNVSAKRATSKHFAMHCTSRSEMVEFLHKLGCRLAFIERSGLGGTGTLSYLYYVRKCSK